MKLLLNILFERLHRKVFDSVYIHDDFRHKDNQLTKLDFLNEKLYNYLCKYFVGWRFSLKINLPFVKRYERYEPKKLDLLNCEFKDLGVWNKLIYSIRYELKKQPKWKELSLK